MASKFLSTFRKVRTLLPRKKKLEDYYEIRAIIGSGNYSTVRLGVHKKTGEEVALKIIQKDQISEYERDNLSTEIEVLRHYGNHPNIVGLKDVFEDRRRMVLVMELMQGGELLEQIRSKRFYSEKEASCIMKRVIEAVAHLHRNGVVHRDLKPENLLFSTKGEDAIIKIADFGFARYIGEGMLQTPCGSPAYVAPEIVKEQEYNKAVDMWSIGVILYILLCGFPPFMADKEETIFLLIAEGKVEFPEPFWYRVSPSARELVSRLLQVDPAKRFTAEEALKHPWISGLTASGEYTLEPSFDKFRVSSEFKAAISRGNEIRRGELPADASTVRRKSTASHNTTSSNNNNSAILSHSSSSNKHYHHHAVTKKENKEKEGKAETVNKHSASPSTSRSRKLSASSIPSSNLTTSYTPQNTGGSSTNLTSSRTRSGSTSSCSSFSVEDSVEVT